VPGGEGWLQQTFAAEAWRGKPLRFSSAVRADAEGLGTTGAQLYIDYATGYESPCRGACTAVDTFVFDSHTPRLRGASTPITRTPMASPAVTTDAVSHVSNASSDVAFPEPWTIRTSSAATMGR
jgi:hypothetical protein